MQQPLAPVGPTPPSLDAFSSSSPDLPAVRTGPPSLISAHNSFRLDEAVLLRSPDSYLSVSALCQSLEWKPSMQLWTRYTEAKDTKTFMRDTALIKGIRADDMVVTDLAGTIWLNSNCAYHFAAHLPIEYSARVMQALNQKFGAVHRKLTLGQEYMIDKYKIDRQSELQMSVLKMFLETDAMPATVSQGRPNLEQALKVLKLIKDGTPKPPPPPEPKPQGLRGLYARWCCGGCG